MKISGLYTSKDYYIRIIHNLYNHSTLLQITAVVQAIFVFFDRARLKTIRDNWRFKTSVKTLMGR